MDLTLRGRRNAAFLFALLGCFSIAGIILRDANSFMVSLVFLTAAVVLVWGPAEDRELLAMTLLVAFLLRALIAYYMHLHSYAMGFGGFISGDDRLYSMKAFRIALVWQGLPFNNVSDVSGGAAGYGVNPFTYLLALVYRFFHPSYFSSKLVNCFIGSVTPLVIYAMGKRLFSSGAARLAAILASFYPSLVRWSACNLRDPLTIFLGVSSLYLIVNQGKGTLRVLKLVTVPLLLYLLARLQIIDCCAIVGAAAIYGLYRLFVILGRRWRILLLVSILSIGSVGYDVARPHLARLMYRVLYRHTGLSLSDSSGYNIYDVATMKAIESGSLTIAPLGRAYLKGVGYFLLSPFPWRIASFNQLKAYPQVLFWYALLLFSAAGLYQGMRFHSHKTIFFVLFIVIGISCWAMVEGNIGSAFRHRDFFAPAVFVYSSPGILHFLKERKLRIQ